MWENSTNTQADQADRDAGISLPFPWVGWVMEAGSDLKLQVTARTGT